ncbi:hypothetical protein D3C79_881050 [compost metagenome]
MGDIELAAVQAISVGDRRQQTVDAAHIGTGTGFGNAGGTQCTVEDRGQVAVFLLVAAVQHQRANHAGLSDHREQQLRRADRRGQAFEGGGKAPPVLAQAAMAGRNHQLPQAGVAQALPTVMIETGRCGFAGGGQLGTDFPIFHQQLMLLRSPGEFHC